MKRERGLVAYSAGILLGLTFALGSAHGSELRYKPVNPNFGGNPFNGQFLLNNASSQNAHLGSGGGRRDPLANFAETLQRRLLTTLASDVTEAIFGENARDSGNITVGDTTIDFEKVGDQVVLHIVDTATGNETSIELPVPQF